MRRWSLYRMGFASDDGPVRRGENRLREALGGELSEEDVTSEQGN